MQVADVCLQSIWLPSSSTSLLRFSNSLVTLPVITRSNVSSLVTFNSLSETMKSTLILVEFSLSDSSFAQIEQTARQRRHLPGWCGAPHRCRTLPFSIPLSPASHIAVDRNFSPANPGTYRFPFDTRPKADSPICSKSKKEGEEA